MKEKRWKEEKECVLQDSLHLGSVAHISKKWEWKRWRDGGEGKQINVFQSSSRERTEEPRALWRTWIIKHTARIRCLSCQTARWIRNHAVVKTLMAQVPGFISQPRWASSWSDNSAILTYAGKQGQFLMVRLHLWPLIIRHIWISFSVFTRRNLTGSCLGSLKLIKLLTCCHLVLHMLTAVSA